MFSLYLPISVRHQTFFIWPRNTTPNAPRFSQHSGLIDFSGRYFVTFGPGVHGPIVWDLVTNQIYPVTAQNDVSQDGRFYEFTSWGFCSCLLFQIIEPNTVVRFAATMK